MRTRLRLYADRWRHRLRTAFYLIVLVSANIAGLAAPAAAADGGSSVWRWMDITDSHGNSAWGYTMSLDTGGWSDPGKAVFGTLTAVCWFFYQWLVIIAIWLINFALSLDWFQPLETPANNIALALQRILDATHLSSLMLGLTAVVIGYLIIRGKLAAAIFEWAIVLIVLVLGTGVLSNPVNKAVGTDGTTDQVVPSADGRGWLEQATAAGLEVAGGLQKNGLDKADYGDHNVGLTGFADPDEVREDISADLVDTFLRTPHQLINYGKVLDGTGCEDAYDKSLNLSPPPQPPFVKGTLAEGESVKIDPDDIPDEDDPGYEEWHTWILWVANGKEDQIDELVEGIEETGELGFVTGVDGEYTGPGTAEPREIVSECDAAAGERASNPSAGMVGDAVTMTPGSAALLAFGVLVALTLIFCGVEFLWCCLRAIWDLVKGLGPGNTRNGLWQTLSTAVWALAGAFTTSIVLVMFLLVVNKVADTFEDESIMGAFAVVDVLLLAFLFLFWRLRRRMRNAADATARLLSKTPGNKPARMPTRGITPGQAMAGYYGAKTVTKGGSKAIKLGASAAAKGGIGVAVGTLGAGGLAIAAGGKAGKAAKRLKDRVLSRQAKPKPGTAQSRALPERGTRPHGNADGADDRANRRGLPTPRNHRSHGRGPKGQRTPNYSGRARPKFTPRHNAKHEALLRKLRHARTGQPPTPGGPEPRTAYRQDVVNGVTVYTPTGNEDDDATDD